MHISTHILGKMLGSYAGLGQDTSDVIAPSKSGNALSNSGMVADHDHAEIMPNKRMHAAICDAFRSHFCDNVYAAIGREWAPALGGIECDDNLLHSRAACISIDSAASHLLGFALHSSRNNFRPQRIKFSHAMRFITLFATALAAGLAAAVWSMTTRFIFTHTNMLTGLLCRQQLYSGHIGRQGRCKSTSPHVNQFCDHI
jgi:hypothetical protein